jgi:hypothetical protein
MQSEQPWCVYCGKTSLGTSTDHMPPITVFDQRQRHKGLEFLACDDCHAGTRPLDQIAGFLCRLYVKGNFDVALRVFQQAGIFQQGKRRWPGVCAYGDFPRGILISCCRGSRCLPTREVLGAEQDSAFRPGFLKAPFRL